ncbi:MAG: hypothetical protein JW913_03835 [Chitinispirillaceae bacterium]|nr:hypothetical protein [Chitinispirillaceae bacterium]
MCSENGTVFAGAFSGGIFKSTDRGATWTPTDSNLSAVTITALTLVGNRLTVYTDGHGKLFSTDEGAHWVSVTIRGADFQTLSVAAGSDGEIFAQEYCCLSRSTDGGQTWSEVSALAPYNFPMVVAGNGVLIRADEPYKGIVRSTDSGARWTSVTSDLFGDKRAGVLSIGDTGNIVAGTEEGIYYSTDYGASWTAANGGKSRMGVNTLGVDVDGTMYAGTSAGVLRSIDGGMVWAPFSTGITELWNGYLLECRTQDLQAEITINGAQLRSTSESEGIGSFSIAADKIGRSDAAQRLSNKLQRVVANGSVVSIERGNVIEEFSISSTGIRQDFVIIDRPRGNGDLLLELAIEGATAQFGKTDDCVELLMHNGRKLIYNALNVVDAVGRNLAARFENGEHCNVIVSVEDGDAIYPVRIDPTITDADWLSMGAYPGVDGRVLALAVDASGNVYAGGDFIAAGEVIANRIAKWDGAVWSALGSGMDSVVLALAIDDSGNVYAGGQFTVAGGTPASYIAKWNGVAWSTLGSGVGRGTTFGVAALTIDDSGNVYAGGFFDSAGGVAAGNIAKWDGETWSALGSGVNRPDRGTGINTRVPYVHSLATDASGNLFAGGWFDSAGTVVVNGIAKWDGETWSALGSGVSLRTKSHPYVKALAFDDSGNLYVGGLFDTVSGTAAKRIAVWNGDTWSALDSVTTYSITSLAIHGSGSLYAAVDDTYIVKWDGNAWSTLKCSMFRFAYVCALDPSDNLYIGSYGGGFGVECGIARWDGSAWSALGSGTNGRVTSLAVDSTGNLYAQGYFTTIGQTAANGIAKWDGSAWSALGTGVNGDIADLAVDRSGHLYAGGSFDSIGGIAARNIAQWDDGAWSALGSGTNGPVSSLVLDDSGNLYTGGRFDTAGGAAVQNIAGWNGSTWSAIGSRIDGWEEWGIGEMAMDGKGNLYLSGYYEPVDELYLIRIAKWDGGSWSSITEGLRFRISALVADNAGTLYAGGDEDVSGSLKAIAKWDGTSWSALGTGVNDHVYDLAVDRSGRLYACGYFDRAGGNVANHIAQWDGSTWNAIGSGMNDVVSVLAIDSANTLYAGGRFSIAGGKVSPCIARCKINEAHVKSPNMVKKLPPACTYDSRKGLIRFALQNAADVTCRLFTLNGREIFGTSQFLPKGKHSLRINNSPLAQGSYVIYFKAGTESLRWSTCIELDASHLRF